MPGPLVIYSAAKTTAKVVKKIHQKAKSMSAVEAKPAVHVAPRRARRSRGMTMRRGKVYIGFTGKEVKNALRRAYGGRKGKR